MQKSGRVRWDDQIVTSILKLILMENDVAYFNKQILTIMLTFVLLTPVIKKKS